jgi:hypothetical protein
MKFIITIDTEGDNQWDHGRELTVENIKYVPRFQSLCEEFNIKPTYLVTSEVCDDQFARDIFSRYLSNGKAEVGAHLHSWTTPPFLESEGYRKNDSNHTFASEMPFDLINEKIKNLTDQIENSFGHRPRSFRSGRYGFNDNVALALVRNFYIVDSSITPFVSWTEQKGLPGGPGGPDFIDVSPMPFRYDFPEGSLMEIPITVLPTSFPLNKSHKLAHSYFRNVNRSLGLRLVRKLFYSDQPVWLRPTPEMTGDILKEVVMEAIDKRLPYIVMMFHSSELMPGCSKYRPDPTSVEILYGLLENLFTTLLNKHIDSVTLTEAVKHEGI